jgi:phosphatidylglycerophosphatase A
MHHELRWITVLGLGHKRPAPGTWGSLPPVVLAALLLVSGLGPGSSPWLYSLLLVTLFLWACAGCIAQGDQAEARWRKDPSQAVADETAGQCIPLLILPSLPGCTNFWWLIAAAFVLFRLADIAKPPPARGLQRLPAGWGILIDDLIAGVYAAAALWLFALWIA